MGNFRNSIRFGLVAFIVLLSGCRTVSWGVADIQLTYKPDSEREVSVNVQIYR